MKQILLTVFATDSKGAFIAHALLINDMKSNVMTCEIHIGKMITRFNPNPDYYLEDVLWQLNSYCQIPIFEIEYDVHYPEPIDIEDDLGEDDCMQAREEIVEILNDTPYSYLVINWPSIDIDDKLSKLKNSGVNIESSNPFQLGRIDRRYLN